MNTAPIPVLRMGIPEEIEYLLAQLPTKEDRCAERKRVWDRVIYSAKYIAEKYGGFLVDDRDEEHPGEPEEYAPVFPWAMSQGNEAYQDVCDRYNRALSMAMDKIFTEWRDALIFMVRPAMNRMAQ